MVVLLTVNQLLRGYTSTAPLLEPAKVSKDYTAAYIYLQDLSHTWWNLWNKMFSLLYILTTVIRRQQNLQEGDICLIYFVNQVQGTYHLYKVV